MWEMVMYRSGPITFEVAEMIEGLEICGRRQQTNERTDGCRRRERISYISRRRPIRPWLVGCHKSLAISSSTSSTISSRKLFEFSGHLNTDRDVHVT